ncbi:Alpha/Beta hydrolase protein [Aspergillus pseudoustus]|uniref:Alpha/Beta hydrolase protein n=1 Tax=Aspergillus pseudoustus TaxID=1810923 RepID=A0ABR4IJR7_9EURO
MPGPTIVIVPGLWLGPKPYELLVEEMKKAVPSLTEFVYAPLVSTGTSSPGNPSMYDDAMGIREVIKPLVESGKRLVVIGHSAGAFLSAMATEDLEVGEKLATPSGGGVERFVFIAGGILPVGATHPETTFVETKGGEAYCRNPDELLFHDVDPAVAKKYEAFFKCQPAEGWAGNCTYTGWDKVPSTYILAENDKVLPPQVQEICAGIAKSDVIRIPTGHVPMLSEPKMLAKQVVTCLELDV